MLKKNRLLKRNFSTLSISQLEDASTFAALLRGCRCLAHGKLLHTQIALNGYGDSTFLSNLLLQMYGRCGALDEAKAVFDRIPLRNDVTWTLMFAAYAQNGHHRSTLALYRRLLFEGLPADRVILTRVITACSLLADLNLGQQLHQHAIWELDSVLETALLKMYAECGAVEQAFVVFGGMEKRDLVSWTSMINAYTRSGRLKQAFELYHNLLLEGMVPDAFIFTSVAPACTTLEEVNALWRQITWLGFECDQILATTMLRIYANLGSISQAREIFENTNIRDSQAWAIMITANARTGHFEEALKLYEKMDCMPTAATYAAVFNACASMGASEISRKVHARAIEDGSAKQMVVETALLDMYGKCGMLQEAKALFESMQSRDIVAWNALIGAYSQLGHTKEVTLLFSTMDCEGMQPSSFTLVNVFSTCSNEGQLHVARMLHSNVSFTRCYVEIPVQNAILNMYSKCGSSQAAEAFFNKMELKNLVSWNTMITAYAQHGHTASVINLYRRMDLDGIEPNGSTFSNVATACSHTGMLEKGLQAFLCEVPDRSCFPNADLYLIAVDLLSRAGRLEEAEELLEQMPFEPDITASLSLLSACKIHKDFSRAKRVACRLQGKSSSYVLLSSMFEC